MENDKWKSIANNEKFDQNSVLAKWLLEIL